MSDDVLKQKEVLLTSEYKFKQDLIKYLKEQHQMDFDFFLDMLGTVVGAAGGVAGAVGGVATGVKAIQKASGLVKQAKGIV